MIEVDGDQGEGGGQVLRTALALSVVTGRGMRVRNIRARRSRPGLMAQHLQAVRAAAAISGARVEGAVIGASQLLFVPGAVRPGTYRFDIGTAGAATLVLQTIAIPLSLAREGSDLLVVGGTHVPWSPSYDYLAEHWVAFLHRAGFRITTALERIGFYPKGGGRVRSRIEPALGPAAMEIVARGALRRLRGISRVANLEPSIAKRQAQRARVRLASLTDDIDIRCVRDASYSPGSALLLSAEFEHSRCCYGALGARGKPAERVADEAADALIAFLATDAAIDEHLADQLLLPLALADGASMLRTARITPHLTTNADIIRLFLPVDIEIAGALDAPGTVRVCGSPVQAPADS